MLQSGCNITNGYFQLIPIKRKVLKNTEARHLHLRLLHFDFPLLMKSVLLPLLVVLTNCPRFWTSQTTDKIPLIPKCPTLSESLALSLHFQLACSRDNQEVTKYPSVQTRRSRNVHIKFTSSAFQMTQSLSYAAACVPPRGSWRGQPTYGLYATKKKQKPIELKASILKV